MAIEGIDTIRCNGCGACVHSCPADVIRMDADTKQAVVKYPQDCVVCCWCLVECPRDAIVFTPTKVAPLFTSWG